MAHAEGRSGDRASIVEIAKMPPDPELLPRGQEVVVVDVLHDLKLERGFAVPTERSLQMDTVVVTPPEPEKMRVPPHARVASRADIELAGGGAADAIDNPHVRPPLSRPGRAVRRSRPRSSR